MSTRLPRHLASAFLALTVALAGCETLADERPFATTAGEFPLSSNSAIESRLECRSVRNARVEEHQVVDFDLVNASDARLTFAYSIDWFDQRGTFVQALERDWKKLVLAPGESTPIQITGPTPEAVAWTLRARRPGEVR